jgi:hypothetical protein
VLLLLHYRHEDYCTGSGRSCKDPIVNPICKTFMFHCKLTVIIPAVGRFCRKLLELTTGTDMHGS